VGIPRTHRLRRSSDFQRVRTLGQTWVNRWLVLSVLANDGGSVRVGVAASRRVGGAVQRSRARRLIREAIRFRLDQISGSWDLVFVARKTLIDASFEEVDRAVAQLLRQAGLLSELEIEK
jgi:ribonuclease P protein component